MDLLQFLGIISSIFASGFACYLFFYKEMKEMIAGIREEVREIRTEVKEIREDVKKSDDRWREEVKKSDDRWREEVKKSDDRWYMLLEKMHMLDKDVQQLKNK